MCNLPHNGEIDDAYFQDSHQFHLNKKMLHNAHQQNIQKSKSLSAPPFGKSMPNSHTCVVYLPFVYKHTQRAVLLPAWFNHSGYMITTHVRS